jgi:hypothetical protein
MKATTHKKQQNNFEILCKRCIKKIANEYGFAIQPTRAESFNWFLHTDTGVDLMEDYVFKSEKELLTYLNLWQKEFQKKGLRNVLIGKHKPFSTTNYCIIK